MPPLTAPHEPSLEMGPLAGEVLAEGDAAGDEVAELRSLLVEIDAVAEGATAEALADGCELCDGTDWEGSADAEGLAAAELPGLFDRDDVIDFERVMLLEDDFEAERDDFIPVHRPYADWQPEPHQASFTPTVPPQ